MKSIDSTSSRGAGGGAIEHIRRGLSAALMVVVQATFVASALLLAPIAVVPAGAAAVSATLDQCANGGKGGPRLACLLSQWQNGNINGQNSQYREGDSVPFRALITVPNAGTHNIWIQFDNTKASKHAYDYLTSWNATETGDPTSGTSVSSASPTTWPITTPSNVFCSGGFVGGPGVVPGDFTMYGGGTLTGMSYTTVTGGNGVPSSCTGDQSVTVKVTFTTTAGRDLVLAWGGHIATQQNWGPGTSAINISGSPYHQRILQIDTTGIGNQDRSLKASAVLVAPVVASQVSHATAGQSGSISLGETITDTATVSGSAGTPAGTVDFYVCGPGLTTAVDATGCPAATTHVGAQKTLSNAGVATSDPYTPLAAGFFCFRVVYTSASNSQYTNGSHTNHVTECFTVLAATVGITKTADAASVNAGSQIGFIVTLTNSTAGTATGLAITDALPGGTGIDWSTTATTDTGWTVTGTAPNQSLAYSPTTLAGNSSTTVHVVSATTKDSCGKYDNTASFTTTNDGANNASASTTVNCATVGITKTADAASVNAGSQIGFIVTLTNSTAGTATGLAITDALPGGTGIDWSTTATTDTGWTVTGTAPNQSLAYSPTTLAGNSSTTVHVVSATTKDSCGKYDNTASFTTTNDGANNASASTTVNCATVGITKTADAASVNAGSQIGFIVTLTNSTAGTATGLAITDALPGGTGIDWSTTATTDTGWTVTGTAPNQSLAYSPTTLAGNSSTTVHVVSATTKDSCGKYDNTASFTTTNDGANNASASTTVNCATVGITKTADAASVNAGSQIGFIVTLTNSTAGTATGLAITDALPGGTGIDWSTTATTDTGWTVTGTAPNQSLAYSPTTLAGNSSTTVHVVSATTKDSCGKYDNTASFTTTNDGANNASASTTVNCATVGITKTADAASVNAGSQIGFIVTLTNSTAGTATGLAITDALPGGTGIDWSTTATTDTGWTVTGTAPNQSLAYSPTTLAGNSSTTVHVVSATTKDSCGKYDNTASFTTTNDGANNASASTTVNCATVGITKTADAASVNAGSQIGFIVTLTNSTAGTATGLAITDALPGGTGIDWSTTATTDTGWTVTGTAPNQSLAYSPTTLAGNSSTTVHVVSATTKDSCGKYDNTASFTTTNDGANNASASTTVNCPHFILTKTADKTPVNLGETVSFNISLSNTGPGDATGVTVSDPLPGGFGVNWSFDGTPVTPTGITCVINGSAPAQTVNCGPNVDGTGSFTLVNGGTVSFDVTSGTSSTTACTSGTLPNTVTVAGTNITPGTLTASRTITVNCPHFILTKTADKTPVNLGETVSFNISLSNTGPGDATGVTVSDPLPGGFGVNWSFDGTPVTPTGITCVINGSAPAQTVNCGPNVDGTGSFTLVNGGTVSFDVTSGTSSTTACTSGTLPNTVTVAGTNITPGTLTASRTITVNCPHFILTKTADKTPVNLGETVSFNISLSNTGPGDATGVTVSDPLPGGFGVNWSFDGTPVTPTGITCVINGSAPAQTVNCGPNVDGTGSFTLVNGGTVSFDVTSGTSSTTACTSGTLPNTVTVAGTNITPGTLTASATITVNCPNTGLIAPTQTTCQQYASHTVLPEPPLSYGVKNGKINNVAPGVIFYFTTITVTASNTSVVVSNASDTAGFPPIGIQNAQAFVFTTGCVQVKSMSVSGGTATTSLNPGTYIIQIKYSPNSLVGTSVPNPAPTVTYTFTTKLNNVADGPSTATIQLIPK